MKLRILLGLGLAILCGQIWAQGCPAGIPSAGNPACIPPDRENSPYYRGNGSSNQATAPRMIWADRWGAIAIDDTNSGVGTVVGMSSKRKAEKAAMEQCLSKGGGGCRIEVVYDNQCGVIAWGDNYYVAANSSTIVEASELAVKNCSQHTSNCRIYYSDCSMPERIQ